MYFGTDYAQIEENALAIMKQCDKKNHTIKYFNKTIPIIRMKNAPVLLK